MDNEPINVLVVDDNEMNRDMLSRRLGRYGYVVDVALDGRQGLAMIGEKGYDVILLDVMMPEMSGYDVLERLKADPHYASIPVIMVTAVDDINSVVRCLEIGAEDYLFKPFNPQLLRVRLEAVLSRNRVRQNSDSDMQERLRMHIEHARMEFDALASDLGSTALTAQQASRMQRIKEYINELVSLMAE